ncbi:Ribose 5-phosphate isomerase B [hydrothermal vent metagenome]|uniref:Ribose 5-phosphate isomerase B n=1 Tax=hydrothermal vent metagenome TaxID=652676 RepID=A0A3B1DIV1_9ZZZZ
MKVYVGTDHRGVDFKKQVLNIIQKFGHEVVDVEGTKDSDGRVDYPEVACKVATEVVQSEDRRGVLICMSGIGQAIAANKVQGAYAALCYNAEAAALSRQHNNVNILVLSSKFTEPDSLEDILTAWFSAEFEGGRHQKRVDLIKKIEGEQ